MPLLRIVQATSRVVTELGLAEGVLQVAAAGQAPGVDGGSHPPQVAVCAVAVATPSGVHLLQVAARAGQAVPAGLAIRALQTRARPPDVPEGRPPCVAWRPAECAPLPRELRGMGAEEGARAEDAGEAPGWQLVVRGGAGVVSGTQVVLPLLPSHKVACAMSLCRWGGVPRCRCCMCR